MTALRTVCGFGALTALAVLSLHSATGQANPVLPSVAKPALVKSFGALPLSFELNQGQTDPQVHFLARGQGYTLFLLPTEAVLTLTNKSAMPDTKRDQTVLRMKLVDASPSAQIEGLNELPGKAHYFFGNDPERWRTNVPTYQVVRQKNAYPGIDLIYYGNDRRLEYDFVVAPGADPRVITLAFEGPQKMHVDAGGDLVLETGAEQIKLLQPVIYQEHNGRRHPLREATG